MNPGRGVQQKIICHHIFLYTYILSDFIGSQEIEAIEINNNMAYVFYTFFDFDEVKKTYIREYMIVSRHFFLFLF